MKKVLFLLIALSFVFSASAQEHLSFKGIPITGSITSFCQKLKAKGFTQTHSSDNFRLFRGNFTGREATVGVGAADNGKDVHTVCVFFDSSREWNSLANTYFYYKELYTEKYGAPTTCVERNPSTRSDNLSMMAEVHQGTVTWGSVFKAPGGEIELSIEKDNAGVYEGFVIIRYIDTQNINAKRQSDLGDI
ncbi:MAG: hypothetical protein ACI4AH_04610 [Muribaculaceae bacterium]